MASICRPPAAPRSSGEAFKGSELERTPTVPPEIGAARDPRRRGSTGSAGRTRQFSASSAGVVGGRPYGTPDVAPGRTGDGLLPPVQVRPARTSPAAALSGSMGAGLGGALA